MKLTSQVFMQKKLFSDAWNGNLPASFYFGIFLLPVSVVLVLLKGTDAANVIINPASLQDHKFGWQLEASEKLGIDSKYNLLLCLTTCACNSEILDPICAGLPDDWSLTIVVAGAKQSDKSLQSFLQSNLDPKRIRVLCDTNFQVASKLNSYFMPRLYLFDIHGRLITQQNDKNPDLATVIETMSNSVGHTTSETENERKRDSQQ